MMLHDDVLEIQSSAALLAESSGSCYGAPMQRPSTEVSPPVETSGTDLVLPGAVSETGLDLPADLSFEAWEQTGETLGRIARACQWWIGDWLNFGERVYGEKYAQAIEATGYELQTLTNFAWVSRQIEISRRREILSFGHHAALAQLEPAKQDGWLEEAAAEGWSISELRKQIKGAEPDEPELCPTCGHRLAKDAQIRHPRKKATA